MDERLGIVMRDTVTGFVGTVTAVAEYLGHGQMDVRLTAETGPRGDLLERWFAETRVTPSEESQTGFGS